MHEIKIRPIFINEIFFSKLIIMKNNNKKKKKIKNTLKFVNFIFKLDIILKVHIYAHLNKYFYLMRQ